MKWPVIIRRVTGVSMLPSYRQADVVIAVSGRVRLGDVVIARQGGREVLKRVATIKAHDYYLQGDNMTRSTDSRTHGPVKKRHIAGRVIARLPAAVPPVRGRHPYADRFGYLLAGVTVIMVLAQLYRLDTFIPLFDAVLPGEMNLALFMAVLVIGAEIASLPYLMAMRLSPLAHVISGGLVVFPPLAWTLVTIWALGGEAASTAQFGEFLSTTANGWSVLANLVWLSASFLFLYAKDYSRTVERLRKTA